MKPKPKPNTKASMPPTPLSPSPSHNHSNGGGNKTILEKLKEQQKSTLKRHLIQESEMFQLDSAMTDLLPMPSHQDKSVNGILPASIRNTSSKISASKLLSPNDKTKEVEHEFSFLPDSMGSLNRTFYQDRPKSPSKSSYQLTGAQAVDDVTTIMANIKTGDDAANFFERYGSETPVKFIRLVVEPNYKEFRPYDLVTTDLYDPSIEHYTMSPVGIVLITPNEQSDCIPLSLWMRQKLNYNILRKIPFYKYFLHRKMFTAWIENVRFQLFVKQRRKIVEKLFLSRKSCCPAILATKRHLIDVKKVVLFRIDVKSFIQDTGKESNKDTIKEIGSNKEASKYNKETFMEHQTILLQKAGLQFEESMRRIISDVNSVVDSVYNIHNLAYQDPNNNALSFSDAATPEKTKSLVKIKQEKAERKVLRQKAKLEYQSLPEFIRFIDYMVLETLYDLTVSGVDNFYTELIDTRRAGIFETLVKFNTTVESTTETVFIPTCIEMKEMMNDLLDLLITTVGNLNRVGYLTVKGAAVNPVVVANIPSIIHENRQFNQTAENIRQRIIEDYEKAELHASGPQGFDKVRPIFEFNLTWNLEEYRSKQHDIASLKQMLEMITNWGKELEKLRNKPIGILDVDSRKLKSELVPLKDSRMNEIKEYIKEIARINCSNLSNHYSDCISKCVLRPHILKEFHHQVITVNTMREEEKKLFKATSQIDQMYNLLHDYNVTIPSDDSTMHDQLHDKQTKYREETDLVILFRESKLKDMIKAVDKNIEKLNDKIDEFKEALDDPNFTATLLFDDPDAIIDDLSSLLDNYNELNNLANTYAGYQRSFHVEITEYKELQEGKDKLEVTNRLWELVRDWNECYDEWMSKQFTDLKVDKIDTKMQYFYKESYALHKLLGSKLTDKLRDKISNFKALMPSVLDLGNKNLRTRHFEKLFGLISQVYYTGMPFTLSKLIKAGIMNYKDVIADTSATASGESSLEDSLTKIINAWDKLPFTLRNHRDQHGLYILGSLEDILLQLEDNQVTLQTMLGSRYVKGLQTGIEEWEKKLSNLSETLDEWIACQRSWMYLENIFSAEDIQKQLPAESQKFLAVDRSWKIIMTRTNNDPIVINCLNPLDNGTSLLDTFLINNENLESIQKSLEEYLETKRMAFPRFYFLSNDELLEILSQTRDPQAVQPHMSKCFDAIKKIKFGEMRKTRDEINGFLDPSGELVLLSDIVKAEGPVELWLLNFESMMRGTLYDLCKHAFVMYPQLTEDAINRKQWLWSYPAQVIIAIDQVMWTGNCSYAIARIQDGSDKDAVTRFLEFSLRQIDAMVDLIRTPLDKQQRTLLGALLVS